MRKAYRFDNRTEAGRWLAREVVSRNLHDPVVLGLPRGGVAVAVEIARALRAPLDLVFVRKIGVPYERELAAAAVVDGGAPEIAINDDIVAKVGLDRRSIDAEVAKELAEIERRRRVYLAGRARVPLEGRTLIVVDDGIATGASMRAVLAALARKSPKRLILAIPVAPAETVRELASMVDEIICLETPKPFRSIGEHYDDFHQLSDAEVVRLLAGVDAGGSGGAAA